MRFIAFVLSLLILLSPQPARADWPSWQDVLNTIGPLAGLDANQIEAVTFAVQKPQCAMTIASYTMAQDYSLVGFIGALKVTKMSNVPGMPSMSQGTCTSYNPVQRLYTVVDTMGDKLLGSAKANTLRELLKDQIAEGKSSIDAEIAALPYVGTILTNWNCACDAAFMTNFPAEQMANEKVGQVLGILKDVKSGDIGSALEKMITTLGPKVACELGEQWTGVGAIPVVSDIAAKACESIAGKAVGWVVSASGTVAEAIGLIGGDHIPPDQYYEQMFLPNLGAPDYMGWADVLYKKCYSYFEPTNMAADTAKKACGVLRARYIEESLGKIQFKEMWAESGAYIKQNVEPKAKAGVMMTDAEFDTVKNEVDATCEAYYSQKYPKVKAYEKAYATPDNPYREDFCDYFESMNNIRKKEQQYKTYAVINAHAPFCKAGVRNAIVCDGLEIKGCFADLTEVCTESKKYGGMQRPCCQLGEGTDSVFQNNAAHADKLAKEVGGPYCRTSNSDPLRVSCMLPQTYFACQKRFQYEENKDCSKAPKAANGLVTKICCSMDASLLPQVPGVKEVQGFVAKQNGACAVGGTLKGLSYDPRIANCSPKTLPACETALGKDACTAGQAGFAPATCCEMSVFGASDEPQPPYDPATRDPADLVLTAKIVAESHGNCDYAKGPGGKPDYFKVVCKTIASSKMCVSTMGRPAQTPCDKKMKDGYVTSPCCYRDPSALAIDVHEKPADGVDATGLKANTGLGKTGGGLGSKPSSQSMGQTGGQTGASAPKRATLPARSTTGTAGAAAGRAGTTGGTTPLRHSATPTPRTGSGGTSGTSGRATAPVRATEEEPTENYKP